jgi:hypothetical protein
MTSTFRKFRTLGITAALLLAATAAAAQSSGHEHGSGAARVHSQDGRAVRPSVMEQIAALDRQIQTLSTDMRMLSGEMKIDAMASLLTALVERQSLMESGMRTMREGMMRRMPEHREPPAALPEEEFGGMCAPN